MSMHEEMFLRNCDGLFDQDIKFQTRLSVLTPNKFSKLIVNND
jgi:hypothetical protein